MGNKKKYYITTPIYYPNAKLHLGHAYTTVLADCLSRYLKSKGHEVFFLTGSDEHGQKLFDKAKELNEDPFSYVSRIVETFKNLWKQLGIEYDKFIRTTDSYHVEYVRSIFTKLYKEGQIYKGHYLGFYCKVDEAFFTSKELTEEKKCPICNGEISFVKEDSFFLKVLSYKEYISKKLPSLLIPVERVKELQNNFLTENFCDLSITRKSVTWGITPNEDSTSTIYVWLDALLNYLSALSNNKDETFSIKNVFENENTEIIQFVGKEITRFHAIYWPIILKMLNLETKHHKILAHGWITSNEEKMSKSKGNVVDPFDLIERYGSDALRFFLLYAIRTFEDGKYSEELFLNVYNGILVNKISNLLNRTLTMIEKYCESKVPNLLIKDLNKEVIDHLLVLKNEFEKEMENFNFSFAINALVKMVELLNKYLDESSPWNSSSQNQEIILATVIYGFWEFIKAAHFILLDSTKHFCSIFSLSSFQENPFGKKIVKKIFLFFRK